MRLFKGFLFLVCFIFSFNNLISGQTLNYLQYTTRDGLAGSTVYDMCQDKDGFIWFATNNGLTRFDGKNFKNYTVKDGLPDNEVLRVYPDSMGRVWIASFRNEISYYENAKIHNKLGNKELDYNPIYGRILDIIEMRAGTIWFFTSKRLLKYRYGDSIRAQMQNAINPSRVSGQLGVGPFWFGEKLPIVFNDSIFYITDSGFSYYKKFISFYGQREGYGLPINKSDTPKIVVDHDIILTSFRNYKPYFFSTISGAVEIDSLTFKPIREFLSGKVVTRAIIDKEGEYWFSTLGDGVFKLANREVKTLRPFNELNSWNEVFSIASSGSKIFTGNIKSTLIEWDRNGHFTSNSFSSYLPMADNKLATNRLYAIYPLQDGGFLLGFDGFLVNWNQKVRGVIPVTAIKSIAADDADHVVIATGVGVIRVNFKSLKVTETILPSRATSAVRLGNKYYIGTLNGLIEMDAVTKKTEALAMYPSLVRRITDLKVADGSLWVATSDSGVVQVKNGRVVRAISEKNGLNSNNCRVIYPHENAIWIGTNKGICKFDRHNPRAFPVKYDSYNLLPNDIINVIYIKDSMIYVGTPAGLTYFQEEKLLTFSICKLIIQSVRTEKGVFPTKDTFILNYKTNQFEVDFTAVSIKSAGEIAYYYRIKGLDDKWQNTSSQIITYSSIPPGRYDFEIYAVNKFGKKSETGKIVLIVPSPFWREPFFWMFPGVPAIGLFYLVFFFREKYFRKKLEAESRIQKQLAGLEQLALQSQMNPHFIFNSLNSIQQFVLTNRAADANRYLTLFAGLIRETLEYSSLGKISLDQEIRYLEKYLELEKMRYGQSFQFVIDSGGLENDPDIELPVMLLQPFAENAVRHGVRYCTFGEGEIRIQFHMEGNKLVCIIRDNGPGRKETLRMKSDQHIEYQSKGMDLTQRRVNILNLIHEDQVQIEIEDVLDENAKVAGTEVKVIIKNLNHEKSD